MSWLLHQHNLQYIISPSQIPPRFLISQPVTWMWAIKNTMLISKILKACFVFSHKLMCESGEKNRKLRRIQKAEKNKPLSCLSKRKQVCQLPVDLLICSNFKTAFFFISFVVWVFIFWEAVKRSMELMNHVSCLLPK